MARLAARWSLLQETTANAAQEYDTEHLLETHYQNPDEEYDDLQQLQIVHDQEFDLACTFISFPDNLAQDADFLLRRPFQAQAQAQRLCLHRSRVLRPALL